MRIIRRSRTAIGIDVGTRNIKAAQLCRSDGQYHIVALALLPRVSSSIVHRGSSDEARGMSDEGRAWQVDPQEILSLRRFLRRQGFYGNDVVLAAPDEKLLRGILELPGRVSGAAIRQMARMELSRLHHVAPDSFELVHWELASADKSAVRLADKSKPTTQTLAFGCPHDVANAFLDAFEEAGLNVTALDVRSAAAARACLPLTTPPASSCRKTGAGVTCLLDLQWNSTKLLLVWGHTLIYEKFISNKCIATLIVRLSEKFGLPERFAYQIVRAVGLPPPPFLLPKEARGQGGAAGTACDSKGSELDQKSVEAIREMLMSHFDTVTEELKSPLAYASRQYPDKGIERILLIGDGAGILGISQYLADNLGIEVSPAAPSDLVSSSIVHRGSSDESRGTSDEGHAWPVLTKSGNPDLTVAVGLAKFTARPGEGRGRSGGG